MDSTKIRTERIEWLRTRPPGPLTTEEQQRLLASHEAEGTALRAEVAALRRRCMDLEDFKAGMLDEFARSARYGAEGLVIRAPRPRRPN